MVAPSSGSLGVGGKITLEAAHRKVTIRENGVAREVSELEAINLAQKKSALGGSALAQKHFLDRYAKAEAARQEEVEAENERWRELVANLRSLRAQSEILGTPSPMA
ncbi:MAG: hypothetical protein ABL962_20360 [Fimbriimonadaceae bacterium]